MRIASLFAVAALAVLFAACGQKGPLVLPDAQHPHKKLGVPKPAASPAPPSAAPAGAAPAPTAPGNNGGAGTGEASTAPAPQQ